MQKINEKAKNKANYSVNENPSSSIDVIDATNEISLEEKPERDARNTIMNVAIRTPISRLVTVRTQR